MEVEKLRGLIAEFEPLSWSGTVFRHMFNDIPPDRENSGGARWNPPEVAAIYTSLERSTAIAEANYRISLEPVPMRRTVRRCIYRIEVSLESVIDLRNPQDLAHLGVTEGSLKKLDASSIACCQAIGGVVDWYEFDGLLVPSARADGPNLVIYPIHRKDTYQFNVIEKEQLHGCEQT